MRLSKSRKQPPRSSPLVTFEGTKKKMKRKEQLSVAERTNMIVHNFISANAKIPKKMNNGDTLFAVYIDSRFIPNEFVKEIKNHFGKEDAAVYMMKSNRTDNISSSASIATLRRKR